MYHRVNSIDAIELEKTDTVTPSQVKDIKSHFNQIKPLLYDFGGYSVHYGFHREDGSYYNTAFWCHSNWGGHHKTANKGNSFFDIQTRNFRSKINKEYMDFLLSPSESPWRDGMEHITVITDSTHEKDLPVAVLLRNTKDTPVKVFMNLMVAGRLKPSWGLDYVWWNLVCSGFTKPSALIIASLFSWDGQDLTVGNCPGRKNLGEEPKGVLNKNGPYMSDQPFYTKMGFYPLDFIEGAPSFKKGETLLNGTEPQPCSCIWNRMKTVDGTLLVYDNIAMYESHHTNLVKKGKDNLRGIMDCARYGKKMAKEDVTEIETSFMKEIPVEI